MIRPAVELAEVTICTEPVDFRKQINGLAALVQDELALDPLSAQLFAFTNRRRDSGGGVLNTMPWRPRDSFVNQRPTRRQVNQYAKQRDRFRSLRDTPGWAAVAASMRRFAVAWENPFPADSLADVVAALEGLLVRDNQEVAYKLRVRAAHLLAKNDEERRTIFGDVKDAYSYRSKIGE